MREIKGYKYELKEVLAAGNLATDRLVSVAASVLLCQRSQITKVRDFATTPKRVNPY
jgi:hypothetical protein